MSGEDFAIAAGEASMFVVRTRVVMRIDDRPSEEQ